MHHPLSCVSTGCGPIDRPEVEDGHWGPGGNVSDQGMIGSIGLNSILWAVIR